MPQRLAPLLLFTVHFVLTEATAISSTTQAPTTAQDPSTTTQVDVVNSTNATTSGYVVDFGLFGSSDGTVPSGDELLDLQFGCTNAVYDTFTFQRTRNRPRRGADVHDFTVQRIGMALNWGALSDVMKRHIQHTLVFWAEWTRPGSLVSSIMFTRSNVPVELPVWNTGQNIETVFCVLDDFGDVDRAKAIYAAFADPANHFDFLLGTIDPVINHEVAKVVNNSVVTFMWAYNRPGLYEHGLGILPAAVTEPSTWTADSPFRFTTSDQSVGRFPVHDNVSWPASFRTANYKGIYDLNVQPKHHLTGPLQLLSQAGAESLWAIAAPSEFEACLEAVNNSGHSLDFKGIVNTQDITFLARTLRFGIESGMVLVLCGYSTELEIALYSCLAEGFAPFAVVLHDTVIVDLALNENIGLASVSYFLEPFPLPDIDWLNNFQVVSDGLSAFSFLTEVYALRFNNASDSVLAAPELQILSAALFILQSARFVGRVSFEEMNSFLQFREERTTLGPMSFDSSGLRNVALTSTRQAIAATEGVPQQYRGTVLLTPPVILDPGVLDPVWANRLRIWVGTEERFELLGSIPWALQVPILDYNERYAEVHPCSLGEEYDGANCQPCAPGRIRSHYDRYCRPCLLDKDLYANEPGRSECKYCDEKRANCNDDRPWETPQAITGYFRFLTVEWRNTNLTWVEEFLAAEEARALERGEEYQFANFDFVHSDPAELWYAYIGHLPSNIVNPFGPEILNWSTTLSFWTCRPRSVCLGANMCAEHHEGVMCASCLPGYSRRILRAGLNGDGHCAECYEQVTALIAIFCVWIVMLFSAMLFAEIGRRTSKNHCNISVAIMRIMVVHFASLGIARGTILSAGLSSASDLSLSFGISEWLLVVEGLVTDPYGMAGFECLGEGQSPDRAVSLGLMIQAIGFFGGLCVIYMYHHIRQAPARLKKRARSVRMQGMKTMHKTVTALAISEEEEKAFELDKSKLANSKYEAWLLGNELRRRRKKTVNNFIAWLFIALPGFLITHLDADTCTKAYDGLPRLLTNPDILCESGPYRTTHIYAEAVTFTILVVVPAGVLYCWRVHRRDTWDYPTNMQFGILFSGYKPSCKVWVILAIAKFLILACCRFTNSLAVRVISSFASVAVITIIELMVQPFQSFDYHSLFKFSLCADVLLMGSILVVGIPALAAEPGADEMIVDLKNRFGQISDQLLAAANLVLIGMAVWCTVYNIVIVPFVISRDAKLDVTGKWFYQRPWFTHINCILNLLPPWQAIHSMVAKVELRPEAGTHPQGGRQTSEFRLASIDFNNLNSFEVLFWIQGLEGLLLQVLRVRRYFTLDLLMTLVDEAYSRSVRGRTAYIEELKHSGKFRERLKNRRMFSRSRLEARRNTVDLLNFEASPSMARTSTYSSDMGKVTSKTASEVSEDVASQDDGASSVASSIVEGSMTSTDTETPQSRKGRQRPGRTVTPARQRYVQFCMTVVELHRAMADVNQDIQILEPSLQRKLGIRVQGGETESQSQSYGLLDFHTGEKLTRQPGVTMDMPLLGVSKAQLLRRPELVRSFESSLGFALHRQLPRLVKANMVHIVGMRDSHEADVVVTVVVNTTAKINPSELQRVLEDQLSENRVQQTIQMHMPFELVQMARHEVQIGLVVVQVNDDAPSSDNLSEQDEEEPEEAAPQPEYRHGQSLQAIEETAKSSAKARDKEVEERRRLLEKAVFQKELELQELRNTLLKVKLAEMSDLQRTDGQREKDLSEDLDKPPELRDSEITMRFMAQGPDTIEETFGKESFRLQFRTGLRHELFKMLKPAPTQDFQVHLGVREPVATVWGSPGDLVKLRSVLDAALHGKSPGLRLMGYRLVQVNERLVPAAEDVEEEAEEPPQQEGWAVPAPPQGPSPLMPRPKTKCSKPLRTGDMQLQLQLSELHNQGEQAPAQAQAQTEPEPEMEPWLRELHMLLRSGQVLRAGRLVEQQQAKGMTATGAEVLCTRQVDDVSTLYEEAMFAMQVTGDGWHWVKENDNVCGARVADGAVMACCKTEIMDPEGDALRALALMLEMDMRPAQQKPHMDPTELMHVTGSPEHAVWRSWPQKNQVAYVRCSIVDALDEPSKSVWVLDQTLTEEEALATEVEQVVPSGPRTPRRGAWGAYRIEPLDDEESGAPRGFRFTVVSEAPLPKKAQEVMAAKPGVLQRSMQQDCQAFLTTMRRKLHQEREALDIRMAKCHRAHLYNEVRERLRGRSAIPDEEIVTWLD